MLMEVSMKLVSNALGRMVPSSVNGREKKPYASAFDPEFGDRYSARPGRARIRHGESKVRSLDEVIDLLSDGDTISYPHYYRLGDTCLEMIVGKLREHRKRDIRILGNAFFDNCVPWLPEAIADGTISGLIGNCYKQMGVHLSSGEFLPWIVTGIGHGNRVRKLHTGEERVKIAFGPVPAADIWGNANGVSGPPEHWVGPLGLFLADSKWAEQTCLLAGEIQDSYLFPRSISMIDVDFVVKVPDPGDSSGVGSGTLDIEKMRSNVYNARVAAQVMRVMEASGVIRDGFNFQVGSGAGLIVLEELQKILAERRIKAGFAIGGCTSLHVEMLHAGLIENLLHGQCFEPSSTVIESLKMDHNHHEISTGEYDDVSNKENAVNLLDVAVLSALEIDREFNVNSVCANGRIIGGIGGAQGVAAGSKLTIMFLPLASGKEGRSFPRIVDEVFTISIPGEVIDAVVTEEYVALNPCSSSPYRDDLSRNASDRGLKLISIEELQSISLEKAHEMGALQKRRALTEDIVEVVEWRDGTLLDTIFRPAEP
jgi:citrate lyase subunit alpha/citrate CoA-transferase